MSLRYTAIVIVLTCLGFCFFAANQTNNITEYETATLIVCIVAGTFSAVALAMQGLRSTSLLYITRTSGIAVLIATAFIMPSSLLTAAFILMTIAQLAFFSEHIISDFVQDSGVASEETFILRSPYSVLMWFTFAWTVMWATLLESIHLFLDDKPIFGGVTLIVALTITALFLPSQLRILLRRCVIVPHGIVISDLISLTDVVLFPLAKIASVSTQPDIGTLDDETFATTHTHGKVVVIELAETTDSLIVREFVNETARKNVQRVVLSIAQSEKFVATFYKRFHKVEPQHLTPSQEKMVEKELGIETAPRSDAKLPQWRKKKK